MNLDSLEKKLLRAGRSQKPDEAVPYAFATRIMAHLDAPLGDVWDQWGRALWRSATACVAAAAVLCAVAFFLQPQTTSTPSLPDLSQVFTSTVYTMTEQLGGLP